MNAPKILLRTGWATKNVGDVAHTPGTLRLLYERFPQALITVWSNNLNDQVHTMLRQRFPTVSFVKGHLHDEDKPVPVELASALDGSDLFITNSGMLMNYGLFNFNWGGPIYNLTPCWRCLDRGIPFGLFGQSFDRFAEPSPALFRPTLNQAAFIFTRETQSIDYLASHNIIGPHIEFGPDGAFGIDVRADSEARQWLAAHDLKPGEFLIVNIRTNTAVSADTDTPLNPVHPNPEQQAENERWMQTCAEVIRHWVAETGRKVLVAPEAEKEIAAADQLLLPRIDAVTRQHIVVRKTWWNANLAFATFASARVAFGLEPHTLIMALCGGVPIVHARPLRHGRKGWMFRDIGLGYCLFDIDATPATDIAHQVTQLSEDHTTAKAAAQDAMHHVRQRQARMLDVIETTLSSPKPHR